MTNQLNQSALPDKSYVTQLANMLLVFLASTVIIVLLALYINNLQAVDKKPDAEQTAKNLQPVGRYYQR